MPRTAVFQGITLTGADASTPVAALQRLLRGGGVEIAFLFSLDESGPRFVDLDWLRRTLPQLHGPLALHVCGASARRALVDGGLDGVLPHLARLQVNGPVSAGELPVLATRGLQLITQHDAAHPSLAAQPLAGHALLVDASGGTGALPARWQRPATPKPVGFAGGLRLDNLSTQLPAIAAVAEGDWWIDLETGLRNADDRFDPTLAAAVAQRVVALGLRPGALWTGSAV